ncbi:hypothetical protein M2103_002365 [Ereboglobus sp. PH5-5]|nr:hypothetical protein [Ereboglobus sp. PH5-5]
MPRVQDAQHEGARKQIPITHKGRLRHAQRTGEGGGIPYLTVAMRKHPSKPLKKRGRGLPSDPVGELENITLYKSDKKVFQPALPGTFVTCEKRDGEAAVKPKLLLSGDSGIREGKPRAHRQIECVRRGFPRHRALGPMTRCRAIETTLCGRARRTRDAMPQKGREAAESHLR